MGQSRSVRSMQADLDCVEDADCRSTTARDRPRSDGKAGSLHRRSGASRDRRHAFRADPSRHRDLRSAGVHRQPALARDLHHVIRAVPTHRRRAARRRTWRADARRSDERSRRTRRRRRAASRPARRAAARATPRRSACARRERAAARIAPSRATFAAMRAGSSPVPERYGPAMRIIMAVVVRRGVVPRRLTRTPSSPRPLPRTRSIRVSGRSQISATVAYSAPEIAGCTNAAKIATR